MSEFTQARVHRGAKLLDAKAPGWRRQVDPSTLEVASVRNCVVSQVFGGYVFGLSQLGLVGDLDGQVKHGFEAYADGWSGEMTALTQAWKKELSAVHV